MQYPGYNTGNTILTEGQWFPFIIVKQVQLQDEEWYYILEDINQQKHFMPSAYYENYGFKTGDEISCKIDRINCTGRIFLEPRHPLYTEGEIYPFDVVEYHSCSDPGKVTVKEIFGKNIEIKLCRNITSAAINAKTVGCIVKSIKKGIPFLEILSE